VNNTEIIFIKYGHMPIFQATARSTFTQAKTKNKQPPPGYKKDEMKKWLPDIIYKLFCFLLSYFFPSKAKDSNGNRKPAPAFVKGVCMPVISCFIIDSSAPNEKTLWRHTVFRGGISA
jgi:hypothetical protein